MTEAVEKIVRIGGASGFWGDSSVGPAQLVAAGNIDYLVFDYLAELTMSLLAGARMKNPDAGYATDFVTVAMASVLKDVVAKGIRVVSNAGGVNPQGCAKALGELARSLGIPDLRIAVIEGDNVLPLLGELAQEDVRELQSGKPLPEKLVSANAYLGALSVRDALDAGAQVVITGRCVDSAVTLGALMHEFGWQANDYDRLAAGSLAGHVIECGCQATGGLHTDWESVPDWANIGYPIVECHADGSFVVSKPEGTGGLVNCATVGEQILYEIGDPANYLLADVACDFRHVRLEQQGKNRVRVAGAKGRAPTAFYKVSATYTAGFRTSAQLTIVGIDAVRKAQRTGAALIERSAGIFDRMGLPAFTATNVEVLGAESTYGPLAQAAGTREAVLRVTVSHSQKAALELFAREIAAAGTSWSPGTTGAGGRPSVSPSIRQFAFLLDKMRLQPKVVIGPVEIPTLMPPVPPAESATPLETDMEQAASLEPDVEVPLVQLAYARSGDKGDISNIGVIARTPALLPVLRAQLGAARVAGYLAHLVKGPVTRYDLPGLGAMNFVCEQALGGGGMASMRNDPLGKGMAQILLSMPVRVPQSMVPKT
ncbi:MAG: acyclic terpene utilization AtuA family protein [Pseudomonadota bacterium]